MGDVLILFKNSKKLKLFDKLLNNNDIIYKKESRGGLYLSLSLSFSLSLFNLFLPVNLLLSPAASFFSAICCLLAYALHLLS